MMPNSAGANADYAGAFSLWISGWRMSPAAWRSFCPLGRLAHFMNKALIGIIGSAVLTFSGIILRLNAHSMAWSGWTSFSGPASETSWGKEEAAISQISMALTYAGVLSFVVTYVYWLFDKKADK